MYKPGNLVNNYFKLYSKNIMNDKQRRFVKEYLIDLNATQAAIRAGYSPNTAESQGSRLLTNEEVKRLVLEGQAKRAEKLDRNAQDAIKDILRIADLAERVGDLKTAMRGFELEAKHHGGFIERKADVDTNGKDVPKEVTVKFIGVDE